MKIQKFSSYIIAATLSTHAAFAESNILYSSELYTAEIFNGFEDENLPEILQALQSNKTQEWSDNPYKNLINNAICTKKVNQETLLQLSRLEQFIEGRIQGETFLGLDDAPKVANLKKEIIELGGFTKLTEILENQEAWEKSGWHEDKEKDLEKLKAIVNKVTKFPLGNLETLLEQAKTIIEENAISDDKTIEALSNVVDEIDTLQDDKAAQEKKRKVYAKTRCEILIDIVNLLKENEVFRIQEKDKSTEQQKKEYKAIVTKIAKDAKKEVQLMSLLSLALDGNLGNTIDEARKRAYEVKLKKDIQMMETDKIFVVIATALLPKGTSQEEISKEAQELQEKSSKEAQELQEKLDKSKVFYNEQVKPVSKELKEYLLEKPISAMHQGNNKEELFIVI